MKRFRPARAVLVGLCTLVGICLVAPTLVVIPASFTSVHSFKFPPPGWSTEWYARFFTDGIWLEAVGNSVTVAVGATLLATVTGTLAAVALDRAGYRGKSVLSGLLVTPVIVPVILFAIGVYFTFLRWNLAGTAVGLALAHAVIAVPLVIRPVAASLAKHDRRLEQAAASLGAPPVATFFQVTLPLILPGVLAGAVFAFITSFDEVIIALLLSTPDFQTLPVMMYNAVVEQVDPTMAVASAFILVTTGVLMWIGLKLGGKEAATRVL
jgi:putative spermidine/putrescine transport system permease protein